MGLFAIYPIKSSASASGWDHTSVRQYRAAFDSSSDESYVLKNLGSSVYPYAPHPSDPKRLITGWEVDQDSEAGIVPFVPDLTDNNNTNRGMPCYWWDITINFGPVNLLEVTLTGNPVNQPIICSFSWTVFEVPVDVAVVGKNSDGSYQFAAVTNSAHMPFDPSVVRDQLRGSIRVSENVLDYDPATYWNVGNAINNDLWNGFSAYTLKWTPPSMPTREWSQHLQRPFYRLDHEFSFNPFGWNATPIDRGFFYLNSTTGEPIKILDLNGQPVSTPCLLDGSGGILLNPTPSNIHSFNYQVYTDLVFASTFPKFNNLFANWV